MKKMASFQNISLREKCNSFLKEIVVDLTWLLSFSMHLTIKYLTQPDYVTFLERHCILLGVFIWNCERNCCKLNAF